MIELLTLACLLFILVGWGHNIVRLIFLLLVTFFVTGWAASGGGPFMGALFMVATFVILWRLLFRKELR